MIAVRVDSSRPLFIEADAKSFGEVFALMSSGEQAEVFLAMCEAMSPHGRQWDYIAIELENPRYADVISVFAGLCQKE